jgi:hypothetical protein
MGNRKADTPLSALELLHAKQDNRTVVVRLSFLKWEVSCHQVKVLGMKNDMVWVQFEDGYTNWYPRHAFVKEEQDLFTRHNTKGNQ